MPYLTRDWAGLPPVGMEISIFYGRKNTAFYTVVTLLLWAINKNPVTAILQTEHHYIHILLDFF
jgi:hypothetical protein